MSRVKLACKLVRILIRIPFDGLLLTCGLCVVWYVLSTCFQDHELIIPKEYHVM